MSLRGLHHAVLFFRDVPRARAWDEKVGFRHVRGHAGMEWFSLGEGSDAVEVMLHPTNEPQAGDTVLHARVEDVDALFRHVASQGLVPYDHQRPEAMLAEPVVRPWGAREFELDDPEGHRWAFTRG